MNICMKNMAYVSGKAFLHTEYNFKMKMVDFSKKPASDFQMIDLCRILMYNTLEKSYANYLNICFWHIMRILFPNPTRFLCCRLREGNFAFHWQGEGSGLGIHYGNPCILCE